MADREASGDDAARQRVVRVPGSRRARLTPVDGTDTAPEVPDAKKVDPAKLKSKRGPNDDRLMQDVPPHY